MCLSSGLFALRHKHPTGAGRRLPCPAVLAPETGPGLWSVLLVFAEQRADENQSLRPSPTPAVPGVCSDSGAPGPGDRRDGTSGRHSGGGPTAHHVPPSAPNKRSPRATSTFSTLCPEVGTESAHVTAPRRGEPHGHGRCAVRSPGTVPHGTRTSMTWSASTGRTSPLSLPSTGLTSVALCMMT